jgi:hypothetical protein
VKLHLLCATNRVPISYELTPANVADVYLTEEFLEEAKLGEEVARRVEISPTAAKNCGKSWPRWVFHWRPSHPSSGEE